MKNSFFMPLIVLVLLLYSQQSFPQTASIGSPAYTSGQLKYFRKEDFKEWQRILPGRMFSADGKFICWTVAREDNTSQLFIRNIVSAKTDTISQGWFNSFSADNKWVLYSIRHEAYECRSLYGGPTIRLSAGGEAFFSANGQFLITMTSDSAKSGPSRILTITDLRTMRKQIEPGIILHKPDESNSKLVVLKRNDNSYSIVLFHLKTSQREVLMETADKFSDFAWSTNGHGLVALKPEAKNEQNIEEIFQFDFNNSNPRINKICISEIIKDSAIIGGVAIAKDGKTLLISEGYTRQDKSTALPVWHATDHNIEERIQYHLRDGLLPENFRKWIYNPVTGICLQLDSEYDLVSSSKGKFLLFREWLNDQPQYKETKGAIYLIEPATGMKELVAEDYVFTKGWDAPKNIELSPEENYLVFYKNHHWWSYDTKTKNKVNLTESASGKFYDMEYDNPGSAPTCGMGGWDRKGQHVYLYDEFDIYEARLNGTAIKRLTNGREQNIIFRFAGHTVDNLLPEFIDLSKSLVLTAKGKSTGYTGFFEWHNGSLKKLMYDNCRYSDFVKAPGTDLYTYIMEKADVSPSMWIKSGNKQPRLVASTNPQQKKYFWTRSELIHYQSRKGEPLQGVLYYPANYEPGKKYPLVVHVYERLSQMLHYYQYPYNFNYGVFNFTQAGYFVFTPDISFKINDPGMSAVDCVVPAVEEVIKHESINKERLGLMGHSWGGYLTTFIISQSNLFKAAVAGAPPTDMVSFSLGFRWSAGSTNRLFEGGQARFSGPFYEQQEAYIRNSSVYQSKNIHTPLLLAFGDKDGIVDWHQGIELYNALRRQGKNCLFLHYAGKGHQDLPDDYTGKQMEFFDHYLKGSPSPEWMNMPGNIIK